MKAGLQLLSLTAFAWAIIATVDLMHRATDVMTNLPGMS